MGRKDRLYELAQLLRDGRLHKGQDLAQVLNVSLRTLYRDMDTLIKSGLPIEGERGLGYVMTAPITLPPINMTQDELEALHLGLSAVTKAADKTLQSAAQSLAQKFDDALPEDRAAPAAALGFAVYPFEDSARGFVHIAPIRAAIRSARKIELLYDQDAQLRTIRPLRTEYWGRLWTLIAWCETTNTFQTFRVDKIRTLDITFDTYGDEPGKRLSDFLDETVA